MENGDKGSSRDSCFRRWMSLQERDLSDLVQGLNLNNAEELGPLINKSVGHFEEYIAERASLAREDVTPYFSPPWCTSLEGSMIWAGGCRPSMFIRLVYALSSKELLSRLEGYLQDGNNGIGGPWELSANQIRAINSLQLKTIRDEDKISRGLAGLQEDVGDQPIAIIAKEQNEPGGPSGPADEALDGYEVSMVNVLEKADELRLNTMKELISILTPTQGVDFLASGKKLHLCLHAWGRRRDHDHGRN